MNQAKPPKEPTQAQKLQEAVTQAEVELFHDSQHRGFAAFPISGHVETWPLRSADFRRFMALAYHRRFGGHVRREVIAEQLELLTARALFEGTQQDVHVRLAPHRGGLVLDLGTPDWSVIEITADGWMERATSPARLIRPSGMAALPMPVRGGSITELRPFLNIGAGDDDTWRMLIGFLLGCFHPTGPYPVLAVAGEQGSAKTTQMRVIREMADPRDVPDRAAPRDERDLAVHAARNLIVAFDNLSYLPDWLSDALSRLATGSGFTTRLLYSDDEELTLHARRPIMLNGIGSVVHRSDLLDRAIIVNLEPIPDEGKRLEAEFWADFHAARPRILGALLDAVSGAIQRTPEVQLSFLPRMADFAHWVTAAEPALNWEPGSFLRSYATNRGSAHELAIEASPVAGAVVRFMDTRDEWEGSATALLEHLSTLAGDSQTKQKEWPKAAHILTNRLKRVAPDLRARGIEVATEVHSGHGRVVRIDRSAKARDEASEASVASVTRSEGPDSTDAPELWSVGHPGAELSTGNGATDASDASYAPPQPLADAPVQTRPRPRPTDPATNGSL
jgi:hypothetical protein